MLNDSRLFVLQVWPDVGHFRAALRSVDETEVVCFDAAQRLCDHLSAIAAAAPAPTAEGDGALALPSVRGPEPRDPATEH